MGRRRPCRASMLCGALQPLCDSLTADTSASETVVSTLLLQKLSSGGLRCSSAAESGDRQSGSTARLVLTVYRT